MKREFNFTGTVTISVHTTVIADTEEEALEIAQERAENIEGYDWGNRDEQKRTVWVNDEYDGEVQSIELEL